MQRVGRVKWDYWAVLTVLVNIFSNGRVELAIGGHLEICGRSWLLTEWERKLPELTDKRREGPWVTGRG